MQLILSPNSKLLKSCKKGDQKAQRELYDLMKVQMHKVCLMYAPDAATAQDMLQEAFIRMFKNLGEYKGRGRFDQWVRRIVINTCINYLKKHCGQHYLTSDEWYLENEAGSLQENTIAALDLWDFQNVIAKLPLGYRTVLNLHFVEGYKHKEIAEMLGITPGTSKSQLSKAKRKLESNLKLYFDQQSLERYRV